MTEITTEYLNNFGLKGYETKSSGSSVAASDGGGDDLGQDDFLKLMITQLTNQDPTNPMENTDFIAQMAQFSTLTGIQELTASFATLSQTMLQGQALQAASLVGKDVLVPVTSKELSEGEGASGAMVLGSSALDVKVKIYDSGGQLVRTLDLGTLSAGLQDFSWDGKTDSGDAAPAGTYKFELSGKVDGTTKAFVPLLEGEVQSVFTDSVNGGLILKLKGVGNAAFSDVMRIG